MNSVYGYFAQAPVGLAIVDVDGQYLKVNPCMALELRRERRTVLNFRFQDITHPDDLPGNLMDVERMLRGEIDRFQIEKRYVDEGGNPFWTQLNASLIRDTDGAPMHLLSVVQNIDDRKQREMRLHSLAFRDVLTGLANRAGFEAQAPEFLDAALRRQDPCGLIVADLNGLKSVNDRWGHSVGDLMISTVGRRFQRTLGGCGFAARLGGDEFAAIVSPISTDLLPRLKSTLERPFRHAGVDLPLSVSLGLAVSDADGQNLKVLLRTADNRMYHEKKGFHGSAPWNPGPATPDRSRG